TDVLPLGAHQITLRIDDALPLGTNSASVTVHVISASEAVGIIIGMVQDSDLSHRTQQPLMATLLVAVNAFDREEINGGLKLLQAFENKVRALVGPSDPAMARDLIAAAGAILDGFIGTTHGGEGGPGKPPINNAAE